MFAAAGLVGAFQIGPAKWFVFADRLAAYERNRRERERIFLSALFSAATSAARAGCCRRSGWIAAIPVVERLFLYGARRTALSLVLAILPAVTLWPFLFTYTPAESVRKIYPGNFFAEMPEFAQRIEKVTPQEKPVFIFGAEPELLFYARRPSATRYIFLFPLYGPWQCTRKAIKGRGRDGTALTLRQPSIFLTFYFSSAGTDQYFTIGARSYMQPEFLR